MTRTLTVTEEEDEGHESEFYDLRELIDKEKKSNQFISKEKIAG